MFRAEKNPAGVFGFGFAREPKRCFTSGVVLPHNISTLLYCFDDQDRVLLMERAQEPNLGQWSPPGGKLDAGLGESPHECARREALEELGLLAPLSELHLTGIVSEEGAPGQAHWLMFLFEVKVKLRALPAPMDEGRFEFFAREELDRLKLPATDREQIWPLFWKHRGGFFAAHCIMHADGTFDWTVQESRPKWAFDPQPPS